MRCGSRGRRSAAVGVAIAVLAGFATVATALPAAGAPASGAAGPRILALEYYEDVEDGFRYNVVATIRGAAQAVVARSGRRRAAGRLSGHISSTGPGKLWFFRRRGFVKAVRADLADDARARISVTARGGGAGSRKRCTLALELDPLFGESATGDCRRTRR